MIYNPQRIESKNIFKHSLYIGITMILFIILMYSLSVVINLLLMLKGFSAVQIRNILENDTTIILSAQAVLSILIFTLPFIFGAKILKYKVSDIGSFKFPFSKRLVLLCTMFSMGFIILANFFTSIFINVFTVIFNITPTQPEILERTYDNAFELSFALIVFAVVPAIVEEFAFRGIVLGAFKKFGDVPAILASAFLFSLIHGNFVQIPFAFLMGICLGIVVVITKSIWTAVLIHFINNSISVLADYCSAAIIGTILIILVIASIASFAILVRKSAFEFQDVPSCFSKGQRTIKLLLSPTIIVVILYFLYVSLNFFTTA